LGGWPAGRARTSPDFPASASFGCSVRIAIPPVGPPGVDPKAAVFVR
jgi:hypothetical protein